MGFVGAMAVGVFPGQDGSVQQLANANEWVFGSQSLGTGKLMVMVKVMGTGVTKVLGILGLLPMVGWLLSFFSLPFWLQGTLQNYIRIPHTCTQ